MNRLLTEDEIDALLRGLSGEEIKHEKVEALLNNLASETLRKQQAKKNKGYKRNSSNILNMFVMQEVSS